MEKITKEFSIAKFTEVVFLQQIKYKFIKINTNIARFKKYKKNGNHVLQCPKLSIKNQSKEK